MEALARARRIGPRIGVVTHADDVPDFDGFRASFGLDIEHRRFATAEDARDCVAGLVAAGTEVIVFSGHSGPFYGFALASFLMGYMLNLKFPGIVVAARTQMMPSMICV